MHITAEYHYEISKKKTNKFDKEALMIADINELFMRSALHWSAQKENVIINTVFWNVLEKNW